jgi:16S rRNA (guanine527-N7)-methyltransferase
LGQDKEPAVSEDEPPPELALIEQLASQLDRDAAALPAAELARYVREVAAWNRKINLTAAREPRALCEVLLADAIVLADSTGSLSGARIIDVGTGAGAPIVPLLLLRSDLRALCVESLRKRATFLRTLTAKLRLLDRMRVKEARLDLERPQLGEEFDLACSRATFAPEAWLAAGLALAPRALVMTASQPPPQAPRGSALESSVAYRLPFSGASRRISIYRRE